MKTLKKLARSWWAILILAALLVAVGFLANLRIKANAIGGGIGYASGTIVGTGIGSAKGITEGISKGIEDGEAAGLSAEDTSADVKGAMESVGRLEVLVAGVTLKNMNQIGDAYKGLYVIDGDAVFSVDLGEAEISYSQDGKDVYITIPTPSLELYLDQSSTKKLAETQKFSWTVTAQDGVTAYLNSMTQTVEKVKESMVNYDSLMETAQSAAKTQVEKLAKAICATDQTVHVQFK